MNKSDEIRRKTWRMIAKNLIVLAALAVAAVIGVMSWFTQNATATADGISATAQAEKGLEIAVVAPGGDPPSNDDYVDDVLSLSKTLKIEGTEDFKYPFLQDLNYCEITGDGISFSRPDIVQSNGEAHVDTSHQGYWPSAVANTDYLSFDLYIRSISSTSVQFSSNTTLAPLETLTAGDTYSKDTIIGAVRMSVLSSTLASNPDSDIDPILVWLPAPHVYYDGHMTIDGNNNENFDTVSLTSTRPETNKHIYYSTSKVLSEYTTDDTFFKKSNAGTFALDTDTDVIELNEIDSNGYYSGFVRVNIWIEGEDSEARLAMVGGKFKLNMILKKQ